MKASVEIIVVLYGQPEIEARCLDSVRKHTNLEEHKLTACDNFTRDKNLGALWNELIHASSAEFVCLLNSDTEVTEGWLDSMLATAEATGAGAVGPMTNRCGYGWQVGQPSIGNVAVETLSGFCLLLRKSAWRDAQGFREAFTFYGQETNFLKRVAKKFLSRGAFVHHIAGASVKANGRRDEEIALRDEFWPRECAFNWKQRIAILGLGPGIPGPLWKGIDEAVIEFNREGTAVKHFDLAVVTNAALREFRPDVVICASGTKLERASEVLRDITVPRGLWFNDLRAKPGPYAASLSGAFSHVFLCFANDPSYPWKTWEQATRAKAFYMPQGCRIHSELAPLTIRRESVFIGDMKDPRFHADRKSIVEALGAEVLNASTLMPERKIIEAQSRETYRQSRFCLSVSPNVAGYTSLRTYNIMAYGGLALIRDFPGRRRLMGDRKHVLSWSTIADAKKAMAELAADPTECEVIRKRAWRFSQARHTGMRRLMNMVANMTTADKSFWGFCE